MTSTMDGEEAGSSVASEVARHCLLDDGDAGAAGMGAMSCETEAAFVESRYPRPYRSGFSSSSGNAFWSLVGTWYCWPHPFSLPVL